MIKGNVNRVIAILAETFIGKQITFIEQYASRRYIGHITGLWHNHDKTRIHFVFIPQEGKEYCEISIPVDLTKETGQCYFRWEILQLGRGIPSEFSYTIEVKTPEIEGIPSFLSTFQNCLN